MPSESLVVDSLAPWKTKRFRDYELSWTKATESLLVGSPLVELRSNKDGSRWTFYNKATDKIAIFFHAAVWAWASPPETGNFVPEGEFAPEGAHPTRMQVLPVLSRFIETSYAINTEDDPSFYHGAKIVEEHAVSIPNFNKYKKPRRAWQEGESPFARRRFILSARLVIRRTPLNSKEGEIPPLPYTLHPWLQKAITEQKHPIFIPNPEMPAILDYTEGKLQLLRPTGHRYFRGGDLVWFSFALSFDVNTVNWIPEYKPLDFIRVGGLPRASETRVEYSVAQEVGSAYQSLSSGSATLLDDTDEVELTADDRKHGRDSDGDDAMSEGSLSDLSEKSAYSAARAGLESATKRLRIDEPPKKSLEEVMKKRIPKVKSK